MTRYLCDFFFSLSLLLLESSRVCNNCKVGPIVSLLCFSVIFFNCFSLLREFFPHSHYTYFKDSLTFVFLGSYQSVKLANKFESPSTNKLKNSTRVLFHNVGNSSQYLIYFGSAWLLISTTFIYFVLKSLFIHLLACFLIALTRFASPSILN